MCSRPLHRLHLHCAVLGIPPAPLLSCTPQHLCTAHLHCVVHGPCNQPGIARLGQEAHAKDVGLLVWVRGVVGGGGGGQDAWNSSTPILSFHLALHLQQDGLPLRLPIVTHLAIRRCYTTLCTHLVLSLQGYGLPLRVWVAPQHDLKGQACSGWGQRRCGGWQM